jgi:hypothetical protein
MKDKCVFHTDRTLRFHPKEQILPRIMLKFEKKDFMKRFEKAYKHLPSLETYLNFLDELKSHKNYLSSKYKKKHKQEIKQIDEVVNTIKTQYPEEHKKYLAKITNKNQPVIISTLYKKTQEQDVKLKNLDFKINKLWSDLVLFDLKKTKKSRKEIKYYTNLYYDLKNELTELRENEKSSLFRQEKLSLLELNMILKMEDKINKYENKLNKRKKNLIKITKIAAAITLCAELYNVGSDMYRNSDGFANFINNLNPKQQTETKYDY